MIADFFVFFGGDGDHCAVFVAIGEGKCFIAADELAAGQAVCQKGNIALLFRIRAVEIQK